MNKLEIISIGGVGGCPLATILRDLNYKTFPYDWMHSTQSFIINSFDKFENFFIWDEKYLYEDTTHELISPNKNASILHDFTHFNIQKDNVIEKYIRRFKRLKETLMNDSSILLIRDSDNLQKNHEYPPHIIREDENMELYDIFLDNIQKLYNKNNIFLLIITNNKKHLEYNIKNENLYIIEGSINKEIIEFFKMKILNRL